MKTCPNCGRAVADSAAATCPNCGAPLSSAPAEYAAPPAGQPFYQAPGMQAQGDAQPAGPYGAPAAPSQPMYPPASYAQSLYGAYPPAPAAPSQPMYPYGSYQGQPAPPSQPMYPYGAYPQGAPPSAYPQAPGANWRPAQAQAKRGMPAWLVATLVIALVAVVITGLGIGAYALSANHGGRSPLPGVGAGTATPNQANVLLNDPLTSNDNGWADRDSHCFFDQSGYHVVSPAQQGWLCFAPIGSISDGKITVTAEQIAGSTHQPYGISFRYNDPDTHYLFAIDSNSKWALFKFVNSQDSRLRDYTYNANIHGGLHALNTLAVEFRGQTITCWINGTQVALVTDSGGSLGAGKVALESLGGTNVVFTNFVADQ